MKRGTLGSLSPVITTATKPPDLTTRQLSVLDLRAQGRSYKEIAAALGISMSTVKFHVSQVLRRTGTQSTLEALFRLGQAAGVRSVPAACAPRPAGLKRISG